MRSVASSSSNSTSMDSYRTGCATEIATDHVLPTVAPSLTTAIEQTHSPGSSSFGCSHAAPPA